MNTQSLWVKTTIAIVVLFIASSISQAQTSINVTAGSFVEVDGPYGSGDTVAFQLASAGTSTSDGVLYNGDTGQPAGGFYVCTFGCTIAQIVQIGKGAPFSLYPNGTLFGFDGVPLLCWGGGGSFNYSSGFSYHINSGVLTAKGIVTPSMVFTPADLSTCNANGMASLTIAGQWKYTAKFVRLSGKWYVTLVALSPKS